ncbi:NAD(P)-dependent oxidoreductase [Sphingobium baderi]|uniref:NAD(P)-dependent oxidoreductase n=1 Tax=Sphingobium baderi TaxID=1332080 RepID=UPI002B417DBA|nr:NAD(P)H-binding protein [Sphingobium baderi]WRD76809.1 NAD(P)H-binding protein [Sphingobium baderi]
MSDKRNILLIGASGMIGSRIAVEAAARGHDVVGVARNPDRVPGAGTITPVKGDVSDGAALAALARDADVIVSAVSPRGEGDPMAQARSTAMALVEAASASGKRLIMVGGAGSLSLPDGSALIDQLPDTLLEPRAMLAALDILRRSDVDWTFFSPAATIEPGERTTHYRLGTTTLISDAEGQSRISAEDYAHALVDEIEEPRHIRAQMTIGY